MLSWLWSSFYVLKKDFPNVHMLFITITSKWELTVKIIKAVIFGKMMWLVLLTLNAVEHFLIALPSNVVKSCIQFNTY